MDDPFPEQDWEDADDLLDEQGQEAQDDGTQAPAGPTIQEQAVGLPVIQTNESITNSHSRETTTGVSTDSANVAESGLDQALDHLSLSANQVTESHSTVAPVDIRSGRTPSGTGSIKNDGLFRNERTPSPNSRMTPDTMHALNSSDGPMTPRNDAGPFVFDGSGGRILAGTPNFDSV